MKDPSTRCETCKFASLASFCSSWIHHFWCVIISIELISFHASKLAITNMCRINMVHPHFLYVALDLPWPINKWFALVMFTTDSNWPKSINILCCTAGGEWIATHDVTCNGFVSIVQNFAFYGNPPLRYAHPLLIKHKKKFPSVFGGHPTSMNIHCRKEEGYCAYSWRVGGRGALRPLRALRPTLKD